MRLLKYILLFFGVLLLYSCVKKEKTKVPENKIEIYLTNKLVLKKNCVLLNEYKPYIDSLKIVHSDIYIKNNFKRVLHFYQIDTISKIKSFKGKFSPKTIDLEEKPIIYNNEIKSFDLTKSIIEIDSISALKMGKILNSMNLSYGQQYVILYNKDIVFTGYFVSAFSSTIINWHTSDVLHYDILKKHIKNNSKIYIHKCYCSNDVNIPEISTHKEFISAFRETNRLIE